MIGKAFSGAMKLTLGLFLALIAPLSAQEPKTRVLPVSGDDLCTVLGLNVHKEEIAFGTPKLLSLRVLSMGSQTDVLLELPATSKATLLIYFPAGGNRMQYWLTTAEKLVHSGTVYFAAKQGDFTEYGLVDGVYTIKGSDSEDDIQKRPAWMVWLLAADPQLSPPGSKQEGR